MLAAAVVIILILLIVAGAELFRHTHLVVKQPPLQASKPPTAPSVIYSPPITPPALEIRLVGTGHCWAEVKVDGVVAYQGTLNPGDTKIFDAQASIWMDLGYPESVDVYYNGIKLPPLGTTLPVERTFTRNMGV